MSESDGIEEAFDGQLRLLVTAASQVGERIARAREDAQRRAQAASEQEARELASRLAAEQRAVRAELGNVHRAEWWDRATPEQIGRTYQVVRAWAQEDPEAARAEGRIREELRGRYSIDVDQTNADPAAVRAAVEHSEHYRAQADVERSRAVAENAEAVRLMQEADLADARAELPRTAESGLDRDDWVGERESLTGEEQDAYLLGQQERASELSLGLAQREDGRVLYDSAERRTVTASELETKGIDRDVVATRMRADVSQAKPAVEAVKSEPTVKGAKARKGRGRGPQVQRSGLDR